MTHNGDSGFDEKFTGVAGLESVIRKTCDGISKQVDKSIGKEILRDYEQSEKSYKKITRDNVAGVLLNNKKIPKKTQKKFESNKIEQMK